uniref:PID domain-containing protein n=1 Tax=Acrobeloides nanus TaxID=290746 RepID=A0A914BUZ7_9BILA
MAGSSLMRNSIEPSTSASTHNNPSENQSSESVTASAMHDLRQSGINFNILFVGCIVVENSLTLVKPETRHDVCSACIRIVSARAGRLAAYETPLDILNIIGQNEPEIKNCSVDMNISMNVLLIILLGSNGTDRIGTMRINIRDISFVSKGTDEDLDKYICFVAKRVNPKTKQVERKCYVFYCESDPLNVVNTISLAFKLREEQSGIGAPPPPPLHTPNLTFSPRSDALDCPTPTLQPQDDPDATPRATSAIMNPFRMPSVDKPIITVSTVNQNTQIPPPPQIKRPGTLSDNYQNPSSSTKRLPDPPPPPIPGPKSKSPNIAVEPSTPITPDGCIYQEVDLPQKMEEMNREPPKDTKGMSFIDKPYTHRRSRSTSPADITIPQMFKNAQPCEEHASDEKSKNLFNFFKGRNFRDSLPRVIFKKKDSTDDDAIRQNSTEAENSASTPKVSFKPQADIIRTSFENDTFIDDSPRSNTNFYIDRPENGQGQMILCGMYGGQTKHITLIDDEGKIRTADSEFNSVTQLIKYHYENGVPITSGNSIVYLRKPVARPEML